MGYETKVQEIKRPNSNQYYVNFPMALAKAMNFEKGESVFWEVVDKNSLLLKRKDNRKGRDNAR
jgi:antitoxin component of MazEF toxin-antitoxin module